MISSFSVMWLPKKIVLFFHKRLNRPLQYSILSASIKSSRQFLLVLIKTTLFIKLKDLLLNMYFSELSGQWTEIISEVAQTSSSVVYIYLLDSGFCSDHRLKFCSQNRAWFLQSGTYFTGSNNPHCFPYKSKNQMIQTVVAHLHKFWPKIIFRFNATIMRRMFSYWIRRVRRNIATLMPALLFKSTLSYPTERKAIYLTPHKYIIFLAR
jgi:hypothetical protein